MAVDLFTCCTCPEPPGYDAEVDDPLPKYRNRCDCPHATFTCKSVEKMGRLCGFSEYTASVPPKKYKKKTFSGSATYDDSSTATWDGVWSGSREWDMSGNAQTKYGECSGGDIIGNMIIDISGYSPSAGTLPSGQRVTEENTIATSPYSVYECPTTEEPERVCFTSTLDYFDPYVVISSVKRQRSFPEDAPEPDTGTVSEELSLPDSEADALARVSGTESTTYCSSVYELRTDLFTFTVRTVKFSLELTNLCYGRAYEGCVRIRKRKAFSGTAPPGEVIEWEDVEHFTFGPITPTSANTEDGVTTTAEITDQDLVGGTEDAKGWEYEIVSAHVWPVSAGCDCPTELGYTDPE